jgi:hypothetical protein
VAKHGKASDDAGGASSGVGTAATVVQLPGSTVSDIELALKQQELRHNKIKLAATVLGASAFLCGILFDQYKVRDTRRHEASVTARNRDHDRMTAIAADFDKLYARTLTVLNVSIERTMLFGVALDAFNDHLKAIKLPSPELTAFATISQSFQADLAKTSTGFDEFVAGAGMQQEWGARSHAPSPDFEALFSQALASEWPKVADMAFSALNARFNISSADLPESGTKFKAIADAFQKALYARIHAMELRPID